MGKEGVNIDSIEKFLFKDGLFSPTRTSARAESWEEIPSITLRIKRNSSITFLGDLAIALDPILANAIDRQTSLIMGLFGFNMIRVRFEKEFIYEKMG